jgi:hypothetical protein
MHYGDCHYLDFETDNQEAWILSQITQYQLDLYLLEQEETRLNIKMGIRPDETPCEMSQDEWEQEQAELRDSFNQTTGGSSADWEEDCYFG